MWQIQTDRSLPIRVLVGVLLWGLIGAGLPEALRWIKHRESAVPEMSRTSGQSTQLARSGTPVTLPKNPEIGPLSLACDLVMLPVPFHGEIWSLETIFLKGLARLSANPLKPDGLWPEEASAGNFGYRCTIKNYGATTLFGVAMQINAQVMVSVKYKNGASHGGKIIKRLKPIVLVPIPLGPQEAFTFYVCNYDTEHFIDLDLPTSATIDSNTSYKRTIPLKISSTVSSTLGLIPKRPSQ